MKIESFLYLAMPVVVLGTLYMALKPQRAPSMAPSSPAPTVLVTPERAPPATPVSAAPATDPVRVLDANPNTFDVVVRGGKRISEPAVLKVHKGDEVTLRITTDAADELHLHGYNLHARVSPEKTTTLQFTAKLTGRFAYEFHRSGLELGALEVFPQ
jgi:hypothetical protein